MAKRVIKWRLVSVMHEHGVKAKDLAAFMSVRPSTITALRQAKTMPRIDGNRLEELCDALTSLSNLDRVVGPLDLLEHEPRVAPGSGRKLA